MVLGRLLAACVSALGRDCVDVRYEPAAEGVPLLLDCDFAGGYNLLLRACIESWRTWGSGRV